MKMPPWQVADTRANGLWLGVTMGILAACMIVAFVRGTQPLW